MKASFITMKKSLPTTLPFILLALAMLALAGCGTIPYLGGEVAGMYATKPDDLPPADTADQIAEHESWCYETLGYAECYSSPQETPPNRLINVDPENRYPLNVRAYNEDLAQTK
jgi:hypothetical protein